MMWFIDQQTVDESASMTPLVKNKIIETAPKSNNCIFVFVLNSEY